MKLRHAATLALPLVFIFMGCVFPVAPAITLDPNVHLGWKCPHGVRLVNVVALPTCAWIEGNFATESCRKQAAAMVTKNFYEANGCVPDPTTAVTCVVLVPPMDDQRHLNPMAPLSQWKAFAGYHTLDECKTALASDKRAARGPEAGMLDVTRPVQDSREAYSAAALPFAQCVAKNDPRLKGN
jgi:hypothetical protein